MAIAHAFVMAEFAARLKARRRALGWSQTELARRSGLNVGNINEVEHNKKRSVNADTLVALASIMHVSTDYLLGLSDQEHHT